MIFRLGIQLEILQPSTGYLLYFDCIPPKFWLLQCLDQATNSLQSMTKGRGLSLSPSNLAKQKYYYWILVPTAKLLAEKSTCNLLIPLVRATASDVRVGLSGTSHSTAFVPDRQR